MKNIMKKEFFSGGTDNKGSNIMDIQTLTIAHLNMIWTIVKSNLKIKITWIIYDMMFYNSIRKPRKVNSWGDKVEILSRFDITFIMNWRKKSIGKVTRKSMTMTMWVTTRDMVIAMIRSSTIINKYRLSIWEVH